MRVTSTVPGYLALVEIDEPRREAAWVESYEAAYPDVFATYYPDRSTPDRRRASADDVARLAPLVPDLERRALALVEETEAAFRDRDLIEDDLDVVLMVGHHTSNGWVESVHDQTTLFLALEFLGDPPYDAVLVTHEALHVAHLRRGAVGWPEDVATNLFLEGLAVAMSRQIHPGLDDSAYLWFDGEHVDWVSQCGVAAGQLSGLVSGRLDLAEDDPSVRWLFTTRDAPPGLPGRGGYWLGDVLVRALLASHEPSELLDWDHSTARSALARLLGL